MTVSILHFCAKNTNIATGQNSQYLLISSFTLEKSTFVKSSVPSLEVQQWSQTVLIKHNRASWARKTQNNKCFRVIIFPPKTPWQRFVREVTVRVHTCVCVCVCMRKSELRFAPPPKWEEVCVCVFVFPISLIIFTDSPTSVTFPVDTWYVHFYSLLFVSRACVCVCVCAYLIWLLSHTWTKKKSFYKSERTAARSLRSCAAACRGI